MYAFIVPVGYPYCYGVPYIPMGSQTVPIIIQNSSDGTTPH